LGGGLKEVESTIRNTVGDIAGMICDGAKTSCALKVASCVEAAINGALLAMKGITIPGRDGIVEDDVEACIRNIGRLGSVGMAETDKVILDIMTSKSNGRTVKTA
jgi:L-cysteine desulfidase